MAEKSRRGFAAMDREKQRQIASKGGKAAHAKGSAHEFTPEQARDAGRKGGRAAHARGTAHKFTSQEAQEAGRKGGLHSHRNAAARRAAEQTPQQQPHEQATGSQAGEMPTTEQKEQPHGVVTHSAHEERQGQHGHAQHGVGAEQAHHRAEQLQ
jgi:general stress protein YciG